MLHIFIILYIAHFIYDCVYYIAHLLFYMAHLPVAHFNDPI